MRFSTLYTGVWPYPEHEGVGLRLEGLPTDRDGWIAEMMDYSCHPDAGARIYARIEKNGFDLLTVMAALDFDQIAVVMQRYGVQMSIIPPEPGWTERFTNVGSYPATFIPPHVRKSNALED